MRLIKIMNKTKKTTRTDLTLTTKNEHKSQINLTSFGDFINFKKFKVRMAKSQLKKQTKIAVLLFII